MELFISSAIAVLSTFVIFRLNSVSHYIPYVFSKDKYLDGHLKYQIMLLGLAGIVLVLAYIQNSSNLNMLMTNGNISAPVEPVKWLLVEEGQSWLNIGIYLLVIITSGTMAFVYFQFRNSNIYLSEIMTYSVWIILFSITNSFSEEVIYRLGVISPALGTVKTEYIVLVSEIIFGLAHFGGMPHGLIGMFMAGFMGWFLAKSLVETNGMFWAWTIHFIQDVVIYAGFMAYRINSLRIPGKTADT